MSNLESKLRPYQEAVNAQAERIRQLESDLAELIAFARKTYESMWCVCKLNAVCGTDVECTKCKVVAILARVEGRP